MAVQGEYESAINAHIDNIDSAEVVANRALVETKEGQDRSFAMLKAFGEFRDLLTRAAFHYTTTVAPGVINSTERINDLGIEFSGLFNDRIEGNENLEAAASGLRHCVDKGALGGTALHKLGVSYPELQAAASQLFDDLTAHYQQTTILRGATLEEAQALPGVSGSVVAYRDSL